MSWWQIALVVLGVAIVLFVGVGFLLPSTYLVTRSGVIEAPPAEVYHEVATLKRWDEWSAWSTREDAELKYTYSGPETGQGSKMEWTSAKMGSGSMELTAADPAQGIEYELKMEGNSLGFGQVQLEPQEGGTKVTFSMECNFGNDLIGRYFAFALNFDKMLGDDFVKCLDGLRAKLSAKSAPMPAAPMPVAPVSESPMPAAPMMP